MSSSKVEQVGREIERWKFPAGEDALAKLLEHNLARAGVGAATVGEGAEN
jgi:hypothetical protein